VLEGVAWYSPSIQERFLISSWLLGRHSDRQTPSLPLPLVARLFQRALAAQPCSGVMRLAIMYGHFCRKASELLLLMWPPGPPVSDAAAAAAADGHQTGMRILFLATKYGPNVLFCVPE
jgi:hypothetical protein